MYIVCSYNVLYFNAKCLDHHHMCICYTSVYFIIIVFTVNVIKIHENNSGVIMNINTKFILADSVKTKRYGDMSAETVCDLHQLNMISHVIQMKALENATCYLHSPPH